MEKQINTETEYGHLLKLEQMKKTLTETQLAMNAAIDAAGIFFFEYYPEEDYALEFNGRESRSLDERMSKPIEPENLFCVLEHWFEMV